jgi:hypothetical protein
MGKVSLSFIFNESLNFLEILAEPTVRKVAGERFEQKKQNGCDDDKDVVGFDDGNKAIQLVH